MMRDIQQEHGTVVVDNNMAPMQPLRAQLPANDGGAEHLLNAMQTIENDPPQTEGDPAAQGEQTEDPQTGDDGDLGPAQPPAEVQTPHAQATKAPAPAAAVKASNVVQMPQTPAAGAKPPVAAAAAPAAPVVAFSPQSLTDLQNNCVREGRARSAGLRLGSSQVQDLGY
jgi:hypothetical protein